MDNRGSLSADVTTPTGTEYVGTHCGVSILTVLQV